MSQEHRRHDEATKLAWRPLRDSMTRCIGGAGTCGFSCDQTTSTATGGCMTGAWTRMPMFLRIQRWNFWRPSSNIGGVKINSRRKCEP